MRIASHGGMHADRIVLKTVVSEKVGVAGGKNTGQISSNVIDAKDMPEKKEEQYDDAKADGTKEGVVHGPLLCRRILAVGLWSDMPVLIGSREDIFRHAAARESGTKTSLCIFCAQAKGFKRICGG